MTARSFVGAAFVAVAMVAGVVACGSDDDGGGGLDPADTVITYRFRDASVPPEHHRSRVVTVENGEATLVVDSYGDVISEETVAIDDATWGAMLAEAETLVASRDGFGEFDDDCVGGTGQQLVVARDGDVVADLSVSRCGGRDAGPVELIDDVMAPLRDAFSTTDPSD